ncbi:MAG: fibro-slime domain-containing protein [Myxococcales bacterium]|nr:fibro-slime domain-containing protein [Myxococcales bacterium]
MQMHVVAGRWAVLTLAFAVASGCGAERGEGSGVGGNGLGGSAGAGNSSPSVRGGRGGSADFGIDFPDKLEGGGGNGGQETSDDCGQLVAIVRDMSDTHEDFERGEYNLGLLQGLVKTSLDADGKPAYAHNGATRITSQQTFSQWYRDIPGVNERFEVPLPLQQTSAGVFVYDNDSFFPLDDKGFGNQKRIHNYHFTTEIRGGFKYRGGEKFKFRGDDDVWVFVNGKLALDLGGVHGVETATIDFDTRARDLGIEVGKTYTFDVFHAERHTKASNFRMETSIECLTVPVL